jgi:hypothetical protein
MDAGNLQAPQAPTLARLSGIGEMWTYKNDRCARHRGRSTPQRTGPVHSLIRNGRIKGGKIDRSHRLGAELAGMHRKARWRSHPCELGRRSESVLERTG